MCNELLVDFILCPTRWKEFTNTNTLSDISSHRFPLRLEKNHMQVHSEL